MEYVGKQDLSYNDYIKWQSSKTLKPGIRKLLDGRKWKLRVSAFKNRIALIDLKRGSSMLCSGARYGHEKVAAESLGWIVSGIDLVACPEHGVVQGDFHDLKFEDDTFDLYFSTSLDHSNNIPKFLSEARRVLKPHALMALSLWNNRPGAYEAVAFKNPQDLIEVVEANGFNVMFIQEMSREACLYSRGVEHQIIFKSNKGE